MIKFKTITLDNGLKIILNQDNKKRRTIASVYVLAGSMNVKCKINDKEKTFKYGIAHFLEHYLIERSMYGNFLKMVGNDYVYTNGGTTPFYTVYYINTVHDFKDIFTKLLNMVNKPIFNQESLNETIGPVLSEIDRKNDRKIIKFNEVRNRAVCNTPRDNGLGSKEDISNLTIEEVKEFYDTYYKADNQIILIRGNFDDDIVDYIKEIYSTYTYSNDKIEKLYIEEKDEVNKKHDIVKSNYQHSFFELMSKLNPEQRNRLDYYISYLLSYNFDEKSKFYDKLYNDKILLFNINTSYYPFTKDYFVFSLDGYSNDLKKAEKLFLEKMNNLDMDDISFTKWKNTMILNKINENENVFNISNNYVNNLLSYDLYAADDCDFINSLTLEECKEYLNKLDLSNYSIIETIPK